MHLQLLNNLTDKHLSSNIPTTKEKISLQPSRSLVNHKNNCRICKHDDKDIIDIKIKTNSWRSSDYELYGITEETVLLHRQAFKLWFESGVNADIAMFRASVKCNDDDKASTALSFADMANKIAGVYKDTQQSPNIQALQILMGAKANPTESGDSNPQIPNKSQVIEKKE